VKETKSKKSVTSKISAKVRKKKASENDNADNTKLLSCNEISENEVVPVQVSKKEISETLLKVQNKRTWKKVKVLPISDDISKSSLGINAVPDPTAEDDSPKTSTKVQKKRTLKKIENLPNLDEISKTNLGVNEVPPVPLLEDNLLGTSLKARKKSTLKKVKVLPISDNKSEINLGIDEMVPLSVNNIPETLLEVPKEKIWKEAEILFPYSVKTSESNVRIEDGVPLPLQPSVAENKSHILTPNGFVQPFIEKDNILLPFPMVMNKKPAIQSSQEIYSIPNNYPRSLPSVTSILNITMPESSAIALATWRKRKIAEIGEEGFELFMREAKRKGKDFHTTIETHLRGVDYNSVHLEARILGYWLSLKSVLESIKDVVLLESFVVHPQLQYKGCVDCVAYHKGTLVLIDWKTSDRRKNTLKATYDDPVQLAAYMGAINADSNYPFEVKDALLVVAYPTGLPADVLVLKQEQCEHYWQTWLQRLQLYNSMKRSP